MMLRPSSLSGARCSQISASTWTPGTLLGATAAICTPTAQAPSRRTGCFGPINATNYDGPVGKYGVKVKDLTTINDILRPGEGQVWISACSPVYVPVGKSLT